MVTDLWIENEYREKPDGEYPFGDSFMTISLGAKHIDGFCYKLVAAVMGSGIKVRA
jgi:hypothetical protein